MKISKFLEISNFQIKIQNQKSKRKSYKLQVTIQDCRFAYRDSIFKQNPNLIIISAILKLKKGEKEESEKSKRNNQGKEKQP